MPELDLIATTAFGLEAVVSRELKSLGYTEQTIEDGRVIFRGDERAVCRCNLWLRSADRVLVRIGLFEARDFDELYDQTVELPWTDWLPKNAQFPVRGRSIRSQLHSVPHCQAMTKKAIVESLQKEHAVDWFPENGPEMPIEMWIVRDQVTLAIDTTGPGLHKRGYRTSIGEAPLKETLAAALVQLSVWNPSRQLADPFCGSGTIPIEAAMIARNRAPGLTREFPSEKWPRLPVTYWSQAREEAWDLMREKVEVPLLGTDISERALGMARLHARQAGVENDVHFQKQAFADWTTRKKYGVVICNPPYGERMGGNLDEIEALYREMAKTFSKLPTWSVYVLTASSQLEAIFGRPAERRRKLYNGRIECTYYQFLGPKPPWNEKA